MNRINKALSIIIVVLTFTSCEDFLEENPVDRYVANNFYKSAEDVDAAVTAIYAQLPSIYERNIMSLNDLPTDTEKNGLGMPNQYLQNLEYLRFTPENQFVGQMWQNNYEGIAKANTAILNIPEVEMDENLKNRYLGEARFLRGLFYFNLVRFFGDVPLVLRIDSPEDALIPRTDKSEVYNQILRDLQFAENNLPITAPEIGRITKGAAKALMGKVYLEKGDYQASVDKLSEVIESGQYPYALHEDFGDNWRQETENGQESILTVEFMDPPGDTNWAMQLNAPKYSIHEGAGVPGLINANEADIPTEDLFIDYSEDDERFNTTFKMDYLSPTDNQIYTATIPLFGKYWEEGEVVMNQSSTNYHILRYADVLLMYAEALAGVGEIPKAHQYLNMVRERAFDSSVFNYSGLSQTELNEAILEERKLEFAYEGHRWFDLVRAGKLVEVMKAHGIIEAELAEPNKIEIATNIQDYHTLYPIPQRELDLNEELEQNPGY